MGLKDTVERAIEKITEAPRKVKERAEEIGEAAEKKYEQTRAIPSEQKAAAKYQSRVQEAEDKFKKGEISQELLDTRKEKYKQAYETEKEPIEKRVAKGTVGAAQTLRRGAVGPTTQEKAETKLKQELARTEHLFKSGSITPQEKASIEQKAQRQFQETSFDISHGISKNKYEGGGVLGKVAATYRPSPQPRIKPGRGSKQQPQKKSGFTGIDFGRLSGGKKGSSGIDFSRASLFGGSGKYGSFTGIDFSSPLFRKKK